MSITAKKPGFNCSGDYCRFGFDVLGKLLRDFEAQIGGVIENKDVEYVHKMRVSTRKLRAVMPLFESCFPNKKYKLWIKEIKKITKLLGEARDLDVQVMFLEKYIQQSPEHQALSPLLQDHRDRRNTVQKTIIEGLENLQNSSVLLELSEFLEKNVNELSKTPFDALPVLEKACWNITFMIDELLSLACYVHQESAILKHHEMRIKAKRLRYSMETFAPLYKGGLKPAIQQMKAFQDLLGEMHDSDVWISFLSTISDKNDLDSGATRKAIKDFSTFVEAYKKSHYERFVKQWDEVINQNFFGDLRKIVHELEGYETKRLEGLLANPDLKVAAVSDIHANLHAFETVIQDAQQRGATIFLNAGDSVGFGAYPAEVVKLLYEKNVVSVIGNFDLDVLKGSYKNVGLKKTAVEYAEKELSKTCKSYLRSFPEEMKLTISGKKILMTHASPKSKTEHITSQTTEARLKNVLAGTDADVIIFGHSHEQLYRQIDGASFVNPGSVGRPGDGNPQTAYALLSFNPFKVELIRLTYPVEAAAESLRKKGLPESFSQMLLSGKSLDAIVSEDKAKKRQPQRDWRQINKAALDLSRSYLQDTAHPEHVGMLALALFDKLTSLHQLGYSERCLLECAALLHDLGLSQGVKGHHKRSMSIILNAVDLPLTSEERRVVASVARYHRKALPKSKHYNLFALNSKTLNEISVLSSILRIADALDYPHRSDVSICNVKVASKRIIIECACPSDTSLIQTAFDKKKNLFEKVFKKKVMVTWNRR